MHIEIQHHPVDIHTLMAPGREQRRKSRSQRFQRRLNRLADRIVGRRGIDCAARRRYRLNRRNLPKRCTADQKAHKKHAAYDE
ncbi:hypothetical protein [Pseudomonas fluorescens]|uniref:hypothetical protein n=1 Tax=Pseudomonas fluorescens TaxID=294 RepID=UPI001CD45184|nr:hypothetical protein [Pseudomonas fluorescens]